MGQEVMVVRERKWDGERWKDCMERWRMRDG